MLLFLGTTRTMEVDIVARQLLSRVAGEIAFVGFAWFPWRLIDAVADLIAGRMEHSQRYRARSKEAEYLFEGARAKFKGFGEYSLDSEVFGWIDVRGATQAINHQEKLLL
jgi:hypothetical protein